jgi:hypothetical protein
MRTLVLLAGLLLVGLCVPTRCAEVKKGPLAPFNAKNEPQNVPAAFHPYNVTERKKTPEELAEADKDEMDKGGKDKDKFADEKYTSVGKYHCLITENELDPVVLLFARGLDDSEGFKELLKRLDAACDKYRVRRLRAFVVFLDPDLKKFHVVDPEERKAQDAKLKEVADKAQKIADELKLENVALTVGALEDENLKKYELGNSALTAVLYKALRIRNSHTFDSDELAKKDAPAIDALMKDVEKHLVPK